MLVARGKRSGTYQGFKHQTVLKGGLMVIATFLIKAIITVLFLGLFALTLAFLTFSTKLLWKTVKTKIKKEV